ncbi:MAG: DNA repair protein RadC [Pseudomonadota bacterium]
MTTAAGRSLRRLRRLLLHRGAHSMSTAELLALLLGPGGDPLSLADDLLDRVGGLAGVARSSGWDLRRLRGIGDARATRVLCVTELAARLAAPLRPPDTVASPADSRRYFGARLGHRRRECFGCLYLDTRHRPVDFQILFEGTIDSAAVYPREILKQCVERDASAVIVGHNHPSGDPAPSHADLSLTRRLKDALDLLDIRLLDHLIVAGQRCFSFAEHGRL